MDENVAANDVDDAGLLETMIQKDEDEELHDERREDSTKGRTVRDPWEGVGRTRGSDGHSITQSETIILLLTNKVDMRGTHCLMQTVRHLQYRKRENDKRHVSFRDSV